MKLCSIGIHKYSKWQQIEKGEVIRTFLGGRKGTVGNYIVQERICEACNKKQLDTQTAYTVD